MGHMYEEVRQEIPWLGILGDLRCGVSACYTVARIGHDGSKRGSRDVQGIRNFSFAND